MIRAETDIAIVGAGPTGLACALWLARAGGVRFRIVDAAAEAGTTSRALVVHARTLELYRQLGIADRIIRAGLEFAAVNLWVGGKHVARAPLGDVGQGVSPFPFMVILPQDEHERILIDELARAGVHVERNTTVTDLVDRGDEVLVTLRDAGGAMSELTARYVAGCDGARSVVRHTLGVEFPGGTYERMFYVADVELADDSFAKELHVALDDADFVALFPLAGARRARLIGTVVASVEQQTRPLAWSDVNTIALSHLKMEVRDVRWFSTYRVHHRVAEHFRRGRAFLLGDAGHIHSPVGGQGMNTGIGDAMNLAWKLREVVQGRAPDSLLDTYEPERIAFARTLVATTDRGFAFTTQGGDIARFVRTRLMPAALPALTSLRLVRRTMFRLVSQTRIEYHASALSHGHVGGVRGGDRLPWVAPETAGGADNFTPLVQREWQVHVYGSADAQLRELCRDAGVRLMEFSWRDAMGDVGFVRDAIYVVRPDGYVGLVTHEASDVDEYFEK